MALKPIYQENSGVLTAEGWEVSTTFTRLVAGYIESLSPDLDLHQAQNLLVEEVTVAFARKRMNDALAKSKAKNG